MTRPHSRLLCALLLPLLILGCADSKDVQTASEPTSADLAQYDKGDWSYEGETGPEQWARLSSDFASCTGSMQSPINLADASSPDGESLLKTSYTTEEANVVDTGHVLQVNTSGGTLSIRGQTYALQQFHVHTPSEHTVKGERYAAEIHLVHEADDGQRAVLGLLVEEGSSPPHLDDWIVEPDTTVPRYNVARLLPSRRSYYTYEGSLTTPPCSEGVRWVVMNTPLQASEEHLDALRALHDGNARPTQPRNDRTVVLVAP